MDVCFNCQKALTWNRKEVSICLCKADLREATSIDLPEKELRISKKIHQSRELGASGGDFDLGSRINDLDLKPFFKILFFFASAWAGLSDNNGRAVFKNCTNLEIHNYLNLAALIFDDFPKNFYYFLDWAKYQQNLDRFTIKQIYKFNRRYKNMSFYSAVHQSLLECFNYDHPHFIYDALSDYIKFENGCSPRAEFHLDPKLLKHFFIRLLISKSSTL